MADRDPTHQELMEELSQLRERIAAMEAVELQRVGQRPEGGEDEHQFLRDLLDLYDRDRQLLAYEIHDGLAQQVTGAKLQFQAYQQLREINPEEAEKAFDCGMKRLGDAIAEARHLIGGLRPPILDESGVVAAIDFLVMDTEKQGGPQIDLVHDVEFDRLARPVENAIYRIVQESLTNARRHSHSARVQVKLTQVERMVRVEVRDWGVGFDPQAVPRNRFGLQGIRERARLLGGQATIEAVPGEGTRIIVEMPLIERIADEDESRDSD